MSKRSATVPWATSGALSPAAWFLLVAWASVAAQAPEGEGVPLELARLLVGSPFAAPSTERWSRPPGGLWYHWLPNDEAPAPVRLFQPMTLVRRVP